METNAKIRIKNILDGKYTDKLKVSVGYEKSDEKHVEGDVWEEDGKTWTIKNSVKRTVNKLSEARKLVKLPTSCPKCGQLMKRRLDNKMWNLRGKCFECVIKEDTEKMKKGTFKDYENKSVANNMKSYLDHVKEFAEDYIEHSDAKHYITETGDVEDWSRAYSKEDLKKIFSKQIDEFKEQIDNYKKESGDKNE